MTCVNHFSIYVNYWFFSNYYFLSFYVYLTINKPHIYLYNIG